MKVQRKRVGQLRSARRTLIEQTRIRQSFERRLSIQLLQFFEENGRIASTEYSDGRIRLLSLENRLSQILLPHYREIIIQMNERFTFTKQETDFEAFVRKFIATLGGLRITQISATTRRIINRTHQAASFANQSIAESFNLPMKKRWISTNDNRTRNHHRNMNGVTVDLDEDFKVEYKGQIYPMQHAGDPRGGPANIINCRCVILYLEPDDVIVDA